MSDFNESQLPQQALRAQEAIKQIRVEALNETEQVRVVAGPGGDIEEIDIRMSAFELSGSEVGPMILEAIQSAERKAQEQVAAAIGGMLGAELVNLANRSDDPEEQR